MAIKSGGNLLRFLNPYYNVTTSNTSGSNTFNTFSAFINFDISENMDF